jgi:hypothetical protein
MAEELNNPLFEDEREFLERKKQEYERALRGDVDHIKEKSTQVGKVALVGAGLAGGIWLISKAFGGKSKSKGKKHKEHAAEGKQGKWDHDTYYDADDDFDLDDEAFALDRSAEFTDGDDGFGGSHYEDSPAAKSARHSARAFQEHNGPETNAYYDDEESTQRQQGDDIENQDFDNGFDTHTHQADRPTRTTHEDLPEGRLDFGPAVHYHKQGYEPAHAQSLAYDDSRRLPESADFSDDEAADYDVDTTWPETSRKPSLSQQAGSAVKAFLETNTGKAVAAQVAAVVLAYVTKKVNDLMPVATTSKNADLAAAPATPSFYPATPQPANLNPAVSLTYTDAPTEHPAS